MFMFGGRFQRTTLPPNLAGAWSTHASPRPPRAAHMRPPRAPY